MSNRCWCGDPDCNAGQETIDGEALLSDLRTAVEEMTQKRDHALSYFDGETSSGLGLAIVILNEVIEKHTR